ncbi:hypothetical protein ACKKBG_A24505 [Auxenochlorella protothecoides x Auxenochlorella symbiontica]
MSVAATVIQTNGIEKAASEPIAKTGAGASRDSSSGVPHTTYDDVDPATYLGPHGAERDLVNAQGLRLKTFYWPADQARSVLLFVHGHGAHGLFELLQIEELGQPPLYGGWVQKFNEAGISVVTLDNQGCGRSDGARNLRYFVESFQDYVNDVLLLRRTLGEVDVPGFRDLPVFLSGISMGGCVALHAALEDQTLFRGLVLLAPMLSLQRVSRRGLNPYMRPVAALLSRIVPWAAIVATDRNKLNPVLQDQWDSDPLVAHINTRVRNANEYLRCTESIMGRLGEVTLPFIVAHSENDSMCDPDGSKALYREARATDKTIRLVNHMWHVLVKEGGNEILLEELIAWMQARL